MQKLVFSSGELFSRCNISKTRIIRTRKMRLAVASHTPTDLAEQALKMACARAGIEPSQIGMLMVMHAFQRFGTNGSGAPKREDGPFRSFLL